MWLIDFIAVKKRRLSSTSNWRWNVKVRNVQDILSWHHFNKCIWFFGGKLWSVWSAVYLLFQHLNQMWAATAQRWWRPSFRRSRTKTRSSKTCTHTSGKSPTPLEKFLSVFLYSSDTLKNHSAVCSRLPRVGSSQQQDPDQQTEDHWLVSTNWENPGEYKGRRQHCDADADKETERVLAFTEDRLCEWPSCVLFITTVWKELIHFWYFSVVQFNSEQSARIV